MKLEGYLNQEMIDYLKDQHIKTTKGSDITSAAQLRCILTNEKYIGELSYGKTYIKKMNNDKVTMINNGEKPKYIIRNHPEAIIDHDKFNQVYEFFQSKKTKYTTKKKQSFQQICLFSYA